MATLGLIYVLLVGAWTFLLPAWFISRLFVPDARGLERLGLLSLVGFSTYPLLVFLIAVALGLPLDAGWLILCGSLANVACGWREHNRGTLAMDLTLRQLVLPIAALAGLAGLVVFGLRSLDAGDVFSTVHHCLYVIAMYAIGNDPLASVPLFDAVTDGTMHYLIQHPTSEFNGLAPLFYEQRIGNAPVVAPPVALFGTVGWLISPITSLGTLGICTHLSARTLGVSSRASAISAALMVYGMAMFTGYHINENTFAVAIVSFLLWSCLRGRLTLGWALLCGISLGHLVGIRYTSSLFIPGVCIGILLSAPETGQRWRLFCGMAAGALVAVSPWLYINWIMLGNPVGHPKVHSSFAARVVDNQIFGTTFRFRALNYPFTDEVVRTAWNPFPTFIWLPLQVGRCFGQLAMAAGWVGLFRLLRKHRREALVLLAFAIPHNAAMMLLESLDWEQLTYAAPGLVPLGPLLALGLDPLLEAGKRRLSRVKHAAILSGGVLGLVFAGLALADYRAPIDMRRLNQVGCQTPRVSDPGVEAMAAVLTAPAVLPQMPKWRGQLGADTWSALAHVGPLGAKTSFVGARPVYPSGKVSLLVAYSALERAAYDFVVEGRELRTNQDPVRSSLGLHMVALKLRAERARFTITRRGGEEGEGATGEIYDVRVIIETPSDTYRDFTVWIHPWNPPLQEATVVVLDSGADRARDPSSPTGFVEVHELKYGSFEPGEGRFIFTNYGPEVVDVVDVPFMVDPADGPTHWGLGLFLRRTDSRNIESLVLSGGHDLSWTGAGVGSAATLRIPVPFYADEFVLYSEPYCSDHVPQYGDRYGTVQGPFTGQPIQVSLDRRWLPFE